MANGRGRFTVTAEGFEARTMFSKPVAWTFEIAGWCRPPSTSAYGVTSSPGKSTNASRLPFPMSKKKCEEPA